MASHATGEQLTVVVGAVDYAVDIDLAFEYNDSTSDVTGSPQGVGRKGAPGGGEGGTEGGPISPTRSSSSTTSTNTTRTVMGLGSFLRAPVPTSTAAFPSTSKALPSSFELESKRRTGSEAGAAIHDTGGGGSMLVRTLRHRLSLSAPKRHPADVLVSHLTWKAVYCAHSGGQRSLKGTQLCVTMTILIGFLLDCTFHFQNLMFEFIKLNVTVVRPAARASARAQ